MNRADEIMEALKTPKDVSGRSNHDKASLLCLSFIGYIARPTGLTEKEIEVAVEAFNSNRGKMEREVEAVEKALNEVEPKP